MADIAVERRSGGMPGWAWFLVALAVIAIIWLVATRDNEAQTAVVGAANEAAETTGSTITSLSMLLGAANATDYIGRSVQLEEPVRVLSVTGDRIFWVGDSADRQIMVALDEQPTPNQPATEGRYDVNPGQMVRIFGEARRAPSFDQARSMWNLDSNLRAEYDRQQVYIHANRLDITSRP